MFYDVYCELCSKNGLTPSGAAAKIGFNRASVTVWKNSGKPPKMELLLKIADYFNVTTDYLLGGESKAEIADNTETTKDEDLMFALFGSHEEITEEMLEDVKAYARFKLEQKKRGQSFE